MSNDWMIHLAALAGLGVVVPVALGVRDRRPWWVALAVATVTVPGSGLAAVLGAVPLALVVGAEAWVLSTGAVSTLVSRSGRSRSLVDTGVTAAPAVAALYAAVAAGSLLQARAGLVLFRIGPPIVELTAVHFAYAGCAALVLAAACVPAVVHGGRLVHGLAITAMAATAGAPPLVATGFVSGRALPQVGGALLLSIGVFATSALELRECRATGDHRRRALAASGLAVWAPMVLAVGWAVGQHSSLPFLPIRWMVRTHGAVNALVFVGAGLYARGPWLLGARGDELTYDHVGSTLTTNAVGTEAASLTDDRPAAAHGVRHTRRERERRVVDIAGAGEAGLAAGRAALRAWVPQRAIGATVRPDRAPSPGSDHVVRLAAYLGRVTVPVRTVAVIDEPARAGFAYGTRPGHPERGEESFLVELVGDTGAVRVSVEVDAVTGGWYRPLAPLVDGFRRRALDRYTEAIAGAVRTAGLPDPDSEPAADPDRYAEPAADPEPDPEPDADLERRPRHRKA